MQKINWLVFKSAEDLAKQYESMTLKKINEVWDKDGFTATMHGEFPGEVVAHKLTGFGDKKTCKICKAALKVSPTNEKRQCVNCIYYTGDEINFYYCTQKRFRNSYHSIVFAKSSEELLQAFRDRAKVIRERLSELTIEEEK